MCQSEHMFRLDGARRTLALVVGIVAIAACNSTPNVTESTVPGPVTAARPMPTEAPSKAAPPTAAPVAPEATLAAATTPIGTVTHETIEPGGRSYRLYVPSTLPDGPVPLFVALHGGTGWGDQFAATNGIEDLAESNDFIVVHPDGVELPNARGRVWNGGMCCGVAARDNVDDVAFVAAVIDDVESVHDIDGSRVYALGHSNGGIMSYRLACELSDRIVGIGVVAGTLGADACDPTQPVSVMHIHGTADENLPLAGGIGPKSLAGVDFPPPRAGFATLAAADECPTPTTTVEGDLSVESSSPCAAGTAAAFVTIEGAAHPWPGGTPGSSPNMADAYADYDATAELVAFLLSHPRPL